MQTIRAITVYLTLFLKVDLFEPLRSVFWKRESVLGIFSVSRSVRLVGVFRIGLTNFYRFFENIFIF